MVGLFAPSYTLVRANGRFVREFSLYSNYIPPRSAKTDSRNRLGLYPVSTARRSICDKPLLTHSSLHS
jgi:hypothetical protein